MSTVSTVPDVIDALLDTTWAVKMFEAWPGPDAEREMIVLGGDAGETVEWNNYSIPTIQAGRKQRQEEYSLLFAVYVGGEGTKPTAPKVARDRAFEIFGSIEDTAANDVTLGTDFQLLQWAVSAPRTAMPRVFERGWMYRIEGAFEVHARLL